jgi:DNA (cytosine-5)-methyltransferase 1
MIKFEKNARMDSMTVGSLFAGVGGICLGFEKTGYKMLWANEFDRNACKTYRENFKHKLYEQDINDLNIDELAEVDILTAGFPCQPFSVAGYRKGFEDSRGNLFYRILDVIDSKRPKILFLENVKNLVGHDDGNTFKVIEKEITSRNYTFSHQILNTMDYGNIPHNRERIFIIAFDKNIYGPDIKFEFPKKEKLSKSVTDLLEPEEVEDKFYYREDKYMYEMLNEAMTKSDTVYQFRRQYVRENKSKVCPTLTANMGTGGHNVPLVKTKFGFRKLTPRECFRFQGFPDNFKFPELANSHLYKQAGNSVSVSVIEKLAKAISKSVLSVAVF